MLGSNPRPHRYAKRCGRGATSIVSVVLNRPDRNRSLVAVLGGAPSTLKRKLRSIRATRAVDVQWLGHALLGALRFAFGGQWLNRCKVLRRDSGARRC